MFAASASVFEVPLLGISFYTFSLVSGILDSWLNFSWKGLYLRVAAGPYYQTSHNNMYSCIHGVSLTSITLGPNLSRENLAMSCKRTSTGALG